MRSLLARVRAAFLSSPTAPIAAIAASLRACHISRPILVLVLGSIVVAAAVTVGTAFTLSRLHDRAIADSERELQNTALVLAEQTDRAFQALELVQTGIIEQLRTLGIGSEDVYNRRLPEHDVHLLLKDSISTLPHIDALTLLNAQGKLLAFSRGWPAPSVDLSDRDYFIKLTAEPQRMSFISEPVRNRGSGTWTIYLARKIVGPSGQFLGLCLGAMRLQNFEDLYKSIALGEDGAIGLFRNDGVLLARYPHVDPSIGHSYATSDVFAKVLARSDHGTIRKNSAIDQKERLIAAASLPHYPVIVSTSRSVAAVLAEWRSEAAYLIGLTVIILVVIGGMGTAMIGRFRELQRLNTQLDVALNNMTHGLCMYDRDMRLIVCNARYAEMNRIPGELTKPGTTLAQIAQDRTKEALLPDEAVALMIRGKDIAGSFTQELVDGRIIAVSHRPIADGGFVAVHEDITERERTRARIEHMARHDPLTGLPNRAAFAEALNTFLERARRDKGKFAILCIDLDRFKEVNDVFGHSVGDNLLCEVARRLEGTCGGAFLARLGGDEFVVISGEEPQPAATELLAERLQSALRGDIVIGDNALRTGLSIGVAIFPADGDEAASILANADAALYRAKADGRRSIRFFDATMDQRLRDCRALQQDLRSAAKRGEIVIHYQPQARIDGSIVGFEALVRWQHASRGMIPPAAFVSLAEESGLIIPLGEWILREACREAASWPKPLTVAVNLSPVQFRHGDLVATVHSILLETGLPPRRLELEITEGVLIGDFSRARSILGRLKALGVKIAMDDFGTGYSSLSYLQTFPFDKIKIDRSFVSNVQHNPHSAAIIRAVIGLGRGLDLPIIAEGVETQDEFDFLSAEICDEVQGYFVGRPAPIEQYAEFVGRARISEGLRAAAD
jgi:diguanylate cyclase (GGDEF)-like protein